MLSSSIWALLGEEYLNDKRCSLWLIFVADSPEHLSLEHVNVSLNERLL
jgi:hypothetical protein